MTRKSNAEQTPDVKAMADELVGQAREAAALFTQYGQEEVDRIVAAAAKAGAARRIELARMTVEETGMGVFEDKVIKNLFATEYIYNDIRDRKTVGLIKDCLETGIMEFAEPLGVILGITPVTNPTSTAMFKCLISLKTRNTIIISAARNALKSTIAEPSCCLVSTQPASTALPPLVSLLCSTPPHTPTVVTNCLGNPCCRRVSALPIV